MSLLRRTSSLTLALVLAACGDDTPATPASDADALDPSDAGGDVPEPDPDTRPTDDASPTDGGTDAEPDTEPETDVDALDDGTDDSTDADATAPDGSDDATPIDRSPRSALGPGPWSVGYRVVQVEYDLIGDDEPRTIPVALWYPTEAVSGDSPRYQNLLRRREVFLNAEPAPGTDWPVLLFSHGNQSFAEQSFFYTEYFASHGWLVAAPDHIGNRTLDRETRGDALAFRPRDMVAALDALYELPAMDPLAGKAGERVMASGHSFGGYTTLALAGARFDADVIRTFCETSDRFPLHRCDAFSEDELDGLDAWRGDDRVSLAIPQTPGGAGFFAADGIEFVGIPTLLMTGSLDRTTTDEAEGDVIWAALRSAGSLRASFLTAGHYTFSNMCSVLPSIAEDDGCGEGFIDPDEAQRAISALSLAFARVNWGLDGPDGEADEILSSPERLSDTLQVEPLE